MEKKMTYNDIYFILSILNDLGALKLPAKAMTEKLLLRTHFNKPMREFEEARETISKDEAADDEAKTKAIAEKAAEEVTGFTPRHFTETAFEQIVEAAAAHGDLIESRIAAPALDEEGNATGLGKLPTEIWLQYIAENLVG